MPSPEKNEIEVEEESAITEQNNLLSAGIFGEVDERAVSDRIRREMVFKARCNYQEFTPCCQCCYCIESRKFTADKQAVSTGFYCFHGEMVVTKYGTCTEAHVRANGRRRVVYDLENAPAGFEKGLADVKMQRLYTWKEKRKIMEKALKETYRGGGVGYVRADGNAGAKGNGQIPRRLGN